MELTKEQREQEQMRFEELMMAVSREGMDKLMDFIRKSDFYTAPASSRYHSNFEGGLLHHSLQVFDCLFRKACDRANNGIEGTGSVWSGAFKEVEAESITIIALLHDLCKTHYYVAGTRNQKTYDPEKVKAAGYGVKHDSLGDFIWETVPSYEVKDQIPYGHGEKSVMMIEEFIKLKPVERYAIRWHMGFTEPKEVWGTLGEAIKMYPIILATSEADLEATYILEGEA